MQNSYPSQSDQTFNPKQHPLSWLLGKRKKLGDIRKSSDESQSVTFKVWVRKGEKSEMLQYMWKTKQTVMAAVIEGDVKKNLLDRTEAEKVFRPWWDTLEDYLLNILIVIGMKVMERLSRLLVDIYYNLFLLLCDNIEIWIYLNTVYLFFTSH